MGVSPLGVPSTGHAVLERACIHLLGLDSQQCTSLQSQRQDARGCTKVISRQKDAMPSLREPLYRARWCSC